MQQNYIARLYNNLEEQIQGHRKQGKDIQNSSDNVAC